MPETLEIVDLESLLNDEPSCQSAHRRTVCTVEVEYVVAWCKGPSLACANAIDHPEWGARARMEAGATCVGCRGLAGDCWRVILI